MTIFPRFIHSPYFQSGLLLFLFCFYFRNTLFWIFELFTDTAFYEYGVFFIIVVALVGLFLYQKRAQLKKQWRFTFYRPALMGLLLMLVLDVLNALFFHYTQTKLIFAKSTKSGLTTF